MATSWTVSRDTFMQDHNRIVRSSAAEMKLCIGCTEEGVYHDVRTLQHIGFSGRKRQLLLLNLILIVGDFVFLVVRPVHGIEQGESQRKDKSANLINSNSQQPILSNADRAPQKSRRRNLVQTIDLVVHVCGLTDTSTDRLTSPKTSQSIRIRLQMIGSNPKVGFVQALRRMDLQSKKN